MEEQRPKKPTQNDNNFDRLVNAYLMANAKESHIKHVQNCRYLAMKTVPRKKADTSPKYKQQTMCIQ